MNHKKTCKYIDDCLEEKEFILKKNGYEILECKTCVHRFSRIDNIETHLKNVFSDSYFFDGKEGYPNYLEEKEIVIKQGTRYAKVISKYISNPGNILDVGCAAGFILKGFEQQGWTCHGIEPNKTMAEYGIKEFGFNIHTGNFESYETDKKFDLITLIQVIGHFQNIDKAIENAQKLLTPEGFIIVESWNRDSWIAKLLGKNWHEYSPPSVIHWFSDRSIINLFEFHGFKMVGKGLPIKQINLKHAISLIDSKTPNFVLKQKLISVFLRTFGKLKIFYPPIDIKWYLFKKDNFNMNKG